MSVETTEIGTGFNYVSNFYKSFIVEFKESPIDYRNKM